MGLKLLQHLPDLIRFIYFLFYLLIVSLHSVIDCFDFLINAQFFNKFFLNCYGLSDDKVESFTKNEYGSLVQS